MNAYIYMSYVLSYVICQGSRSESRSSGCNVPVPSSWFSTSFLKTVVEVKVGLQDVTFLSPPAGFPHHFLKL